MRQGDHILAFWQTQKSGSIPEKFQREHLEHTAQRFARHAHVIMAHYLKKIARSVSRHPIMRFNF